MLNFLQRVSRRLIRKSTQISQTPLNKVSLVILIIVDIFVLINVFSGLYSISSVPLSPYETYPCYSDYQTFHESNSSISDRQFIALQDALNPLPSAPVPVQERRLGKVDSFCQQYLDEKLLVNTPGNRTLLQKISDLENNISVKQNQITELQQQYDSTLLEKIAGQDPQNSITTSTAENTRRDLEQAKAEIDRWRKDISNTKVQLVTNAQTYLETLRNTTHYQTLKTSYEKAEFWYPNLQFLLQVLFLVPLIGLTYAWHSQAINTNKGLQSLLSWHLLLIFCIPLLVRVFQFLQFSNLVSAIVEVIITLVGGLWFIASYLFILIIPLLGFGLIKFLQHFVFNPKVQAKKRIQKQRCIQCNARLYTADPFCPHCGFNQYQECPHCHQQSYQYAPFCRVCGTAFPLDPEARSSTAEM